MKIHPVNVSTQPGSSWEDVYPPARDLYNRIKAQTKRQPYIRAAYFHKDKVFIELFWVHLNQKSMKERRKRLKYYAAGIELLRTTRLQPESKKNPNKSSEVLHRFGGITQQGDLFYIQIKENTKTSRKDLMSVFPST